MMLTKQQALDLHRRMWEDMQRDLGDNPSSDERQDYKSEWCDEHFLDKIIINDCFLCEYDNQFVCADGYKVCKYCPINWGPKIRIGGCARNKMSYLSAPISAILALPEREV